MARSSAPVVQLTIATTSRRRCSLFRASVCRRRRLCCLAALFALFAGSQRPQRRQLQRQRQRLRFHYVVAKDSGGYGAIACGVVTRNRSAFAPGVRRRRKRPAAASAASAEPVRTRSESRRVLRSRLDQANFGAPHRGRGVISMHSHLDSSAMTFTFIISSVPTSGNSYWGEQ